MSFKNNFRLSADLKVWTLACCLVALVFFVYLNVSRVYGEGQPLMPVDDAYIHFQYARQIAYLQPYRYNPELPPTSGATSLIYPYVLAVGHALGFHDLNLGAWALIVGAGALLGAGWTVYLLARLAGASRGYGALAMAAFILSGAVSWHFMSGMETGLMTCFTLMTLYALLADRRRLFIGVAVLLAMTRPEGSVMASVAALAMCWRAWRDGGWLRLALLLPIAVSGIQPLVNRLATGAASASGNQAKSLTGMIPAYPDEIVRRIVENFLRIWAEFVSGWGDAGIVYAVPLLVIVAVAGLLWNAFRRRDVALAAVVLVWLLAVTAAISTLDTAFWHFKRYQLPLMALFLPLALYALRGLPRVRNGVTWVALGVAVFSGVQFVGYTAQNARSVADQPLAMARWLDENTPPSARVAVHDVGMMRYLGNRTTVDMVGLTTQGAADYWRNGPGAVGEFLLLQQPDYVAAYTQIAGLDYLAQTDLYGEQLAGFWSTYDPRYNVALGDGFQGIFKPDWVTATQYTDAPQQQTSLRAIDGLALVDAVNVAQIHSEREHAYQWANAARHTGYATEFYQQAYIDCSACVAADGGRRITGAEQFTLKTRTGQDLVLVSRVHPVNAGEIVISVNGEPVATRWIPSQPGQWLELVTLIPAALITTDETLIRIESRIADGHYMPYYHWAYQGNYQPQTVAPEDFETLPHVAFQSGAIKAFVSPLKAEDGRLPLRLYWAFDGTATGDARLFLHVYDDVNAPPVAQLGDVRLAGGTLSPQNALAGVFAEDFIIDLAALPAGRYQVALGLYDPVSGARLAPVSEMLTLDTVNHRVFLGTLDWTGD